MIAFIGLGNPGDKYANTKHNAGYWVLDELANRQKLGFKPGKGDYIFAQNQKREMLLVKPTTGMNLSGIAVKDVTSRWNLLPSETFIILDLSLIHISEPTRRYAISYAVFCLKKKK